MVKNKNGLDMYFYLFDELVVISNEVSGVIMSRLYDFLKVRLPDSRKDPYPGRHWVWNSFQSKLKKIAVVMIMSGHVIDMKELKLRDDDETILNELDNFHIVKDIVGKGYIDGSYLVHDEKRNLFIRIGVAENGMMRR